MTAREFLDAAGAARLWGKVKALIKDGSTSSTDKTLTVSNAAADAAATGVRIKMLEMTLGVDVDGISFASAFDTLDGVELTGVWNKAEAKIDF